MKVNFLKINSMDMDYKNFLTFHIMKDNMRMGSNMEKENFYLKMEIHILANFNMMKCLEKEDLYIKMVKFMKDNLKKI